MHVFFEKINKSKTTNLFKFTPKPKLTELLLAFSFLFPGFQICIARLNEVIELLLCRIQNQKVPKIKAGSNLSISVPTSKVILS